MKAIQFDQYGGPEVLHVAGTPDPHPGPGQVRLKIRAIGVNPFELKVRSGAMQSMMPTKFPSIPGNEVAGVVDEVGAGVSALKLGDEVFGWSDTGAYAELALATVVAPKPQGLSFELAAALPVAGETATRVLDALQLKTGETLLLHGGAGVVGSAGIQLARARGVNVVATGSAATQDFIRSLGATPVTYGAGLVQRVRALGKTIDAVFDAAGKGALPDSIELRGGKSRIVTIADMAAASLGIPFSAGTAAGRTEAGLRTIAAQAERKELQIPVASTLPLTQAAEAHALAEKSHAPGKIVLRP